MFQPAQESPNATAPCMATLDVHPQVAMQILRHNKIAPKMEIYTEVPSADTRAALKQLGESLAT